MGTACPFTATAKSDPGVAKPLPTEELSVSRTTRPSNDVPTLVTVGVEPCFLTYKTWDAFWTETLSPKLEPGVMIWNPQPPSLAVNAYREKSLLEYETGVSQEITGTPEKTNSPSMDPGPLKTHGSPNVPEPLTTELAPPVSALTVSPAKVTSAGEA